MRLGEAASCDLCFSEKNFLYKLKKNTVYFDHEIDLALIILLLTNMGKISKSSVLCVLTEVTFYKFDCRILSVVFTLFKPPVVFYIYSL